MSLHRVNNRLGRWQGGIRHFCHLLINFYNTKYRSSLSCYSQPSWMVVWALSDRFGPSAVTTVGGCVERTGLHPAYTVKWGSSGAPGCHNNNQCFVNYHYPVIISLTNTRLLCQHSGYTSYSGEKVEEILNKVSQVMNIKVKHRDDQLYNFLISQPGGSQYHQPPPDKWMKLTGARSHVLIRI